MAKCVNGRLQPVLLLYESEDLAAVLKQPSVEELLGQSSQGAAAVATDIHAPAPDTATAAAVGVPGHRSEGLEGQGRMPQVPMGAVRDPLPPGAVPVAWGGSQDGASVAAMGHAGVGAWGGAQGVGLPHFGALPGSAQALGASGALQGSQGSGGVATGGAMGGEGQGLAVQSGVHGRQGGPAPVYAPGLHGGAGGSQGQGWGAMPVPGPVLPSWLGRTGPEGHRGAPVGPESAAVSPGMRAGGSEAGAAPASHQHMPQRDRAGHGAAGEQLPHAGPATPPGPSQLSSQSDRGHYPVPGAPREVDGRSGGGRGCSGCGGGAGQAAGHAGRAEATRRDLPGDSGHPSRGRHPAGYHPAQQSAPLGTSPRTARQPGAAPDAPAPRTAPLGPPQHWGSSQHPAGHAGAGAHVTSAHVTATPQNHQPGQSQPSQPGQRWPPGPESIPSAGTTNPVTMASQGHVAGAAPQAAGMSHGDHQHQHATGTVMDYGQGGGEQGWAQQGYDGRGYTGHDYGSAGYPGYHPGWGYEWHGVGHGEGYEGYGYSAGQEMGQAWGGQGMEQGQGMGGGYEGQMGGRGRGNTTSNGSAAALAHRTCKPTQAPAGHA